MGRAAGVKLRTAIFLQAVMAVVFMSAFLHAALMEKPAQKSLFRSCYAFPPEELLPLIMDVATKREPVEGVPVTVVARTKPAVDPWHPKKHSNIVEGKLYYSSDDGKTWMEVPLKEIEDALWEGTIPAFSAGTEVLYYTWFRDEYDNVATESKPDFKNDNAVEFMNSGKKKKITFPAEKDMMLTYDNNGYDPNFAAARYWKDFSADVSEKAKIRRMWFSQDEDNYYFLVEFYKDIAAILDLSYRLQSEEIGIMFYNADELTKEPEKKRSVDEWYNITYWLMPPVGWFLSCRACVLQEKGWWWYALLHSELENDSVAYSGNKIYFSVDTGSAGERPDKLIQMNAAFCGGERWYQTTWTAGSYVYLRTHSYEL